MTKPCFKGSMLMILVLGSAVVQAVGVTPYLPLNISPAMERQIERAMVLAGEPIMRRPIAASRVLEVLPRVCLVDRPLCEAVRSYLQPYMHDAGVTLLQVSANVAAGDTQQIVPNAHGREVDSNWSLAASAYYQPSDYLLLTAGGVAHQGDATPTGTLLSAGFDFAQLDVGFRDHWFSPMLDSSIVISTEAPTMPSVTVSNSRPISPLGLSYEVFLARMSRQRGIAYFNSTTDGHPSLTGLQVSAAPVTGYAVSLSRIMQYGGGARGGTSFAELYDALTVNSNRNDVIGTSQEFGNQVASLASSMLFPGKVPFAVKMEFAGEDNSYAGSYRLGDSALMLGVDLPSIAGRFDATYEFSEWQNVWYTHHIYPDGLTNKGYVLGHWFGDQRARGDRVTGSSHFLGVGMRMGSGAYWRTTLRTATFGRPLGASLLQDESYARMYRLAISRDAAWMGRGLSAEVYAGRGALSGSFVGVSGTLAVGGAGYQSVTPVPESSDVAGGAEFFIDAGVNRTRTRDLVSLETQFLWTDSAVGYHVGAGFRRPVADYHDLGVRIELDNVQGRKIVSLRALDYRYRLTKRWALNGFFGVGRLYEGATALGYYWGGGLQRMDVMKGWDVSLDMRIHDKLSRNRLLASDPPLTTTLIPRLHTDTKGVSLYISRSY